MQYLIFEGQSHFDLYPLTMTRPLWDLRVGISKLHEKWTHLLPAPPAKWASHYLHPYFSDAAPTGEYTAFNAAFIPQADFIRDLTEALAPNTFLLSDAGHVIAFRTDSESFSLPVEPISKAIVADSGLKEVAYTDALPPAIHHPWDIFQHNRHALLLDLERIRAERPNHGIQDAHTTVYGRDNVFVEEGANVKAAIIDAEGGPVYIGRHATIQPGAIIQNAHAILDHATISMGAKLRGDSTIGPWSKVGGEVGNSVIQGYSNKAHDGYLGNSVIGHWCNLGADTNTSNLKNNYTEVKVWNYPKHGFKKSGTIFCGLIMGDHSKCGINTMFNTGTVVGVSANVFGDGYPRNFIPSFSWGGPKGVSTYRLDKAAETARIVMARRKIEFSQTDYDILTNVFAETAQYRR